MQKIQKNIFAIYDEKIIEVLKVCQKQIRKMKTPVEKITNKLKKNFTKMKSVSP